MTSPIFQILNVTRFPMERDDDSLALREGVNTIVGEWNTGKTKWLRLIDFALGDADPPEKSLDEDIATKYDRVVLSVSVGGEKINIERRWKEAGAKGKIYVNDEGMTAKQFSEFILRKLNIPLIRVPSGNPFGDRTWPELSWRELFRHMYKQELPWSDFAEKQAEIVRSACLLQFFNVAKNVYSDEYGRLVALKKERDQLQAKKDVFVGVMQDFAVDLIKQPEMTVSVTPDSIEATRKRLNDRLLKLHEKRVTILEGLDQESELEERGYFAAKRRLEERHSELGMLEAERNQRVRRRAELTDYFNTLEVELGRLSRVKSSAAALSDLKVTHCPACDRELPPAAPNNQVCHVCSRPLSPLTDPGAGSRRIDLEEQQVREEMEELNELLHQLDKEKKALDTRIADLHQSIRNEERAVADAKDLAVRAIPPDLAFLDREAGQIDAEQNQLNGLERSLQARETMSQEITGLERQIADLDSEIAGSTPTVDYEQLGDILADRMNDYLNKLNADRLSRYKIGRISVKLRRDDFVVRLDDKPWRSKAGGTGQYIIQLAYHYALLSLTKDHKYNYPGILIIDFPPHFAKAKSLADSETYLLQPFVALCADKNMSGAQVIVAGRAFDKLEGAHVLQM